VQIASIFVNLLTYSSGKGFPMARLPRFVLPGHPQHVIVRGNDRQAIFYPEEDYRFYLNTLKDAVLKHDCELHAFVLMTNHAHLLITPHQENAIGKVIQMHRPATAY
jgi:putative transposase